MIPESGYMVVLLLLQGLLPLCRQWKRKQMHPESPLLKSDSSNCGNDAAAASRSTSCWRQTIDDLATEQPIQVVLQHYPASIISGRKHLFVSTWCHHRDIHWDRVQSCWTVFQLAKAEPTGVDWTVQCLISKYHTYIWWRWQVCWLRLNLAWHLLPPRQCARIHSPPWEMCFWTVGAQCFTKDRPSSAGLWERLDPKMHHQVERHRSLKA